LTRVEDDDDRNLTTTTRAIAADDWQSTMYVTTTYDHGRSQRKI